MKLTRALLFLWLVVVCLIPCAAQERRAKNHTGLHPVADADGKWGFIDRTGRFAIAPRFNEAHPFAGGLAQVTTTDGKKQLIDESGKVIWRL